MNPNKPLIRRFDIEPVDNGEYIELRQRNEDDGYYMQANEVESHLSTLTTENQSLKEKLGELVVFIKEQIEEEQINISDMRNEKQDMNSYGAGDSVGRLEAFKTMLSFITDSIV